jgi:hypothetical protein
MSAVATVPQRWSIDRRSAWFLVVAAALGAAVALSASTLIGSEPARPAAPASSVVQPAAAAHAEATGSLASLRPLSDATFQVTGDEGVPAQYRAGVLFNYPGGTVQVGSSAAGGETVPARYAPGTTYVYPGGEVQIGAKALGGSNENAPAFPGCHQCR